MKVLVRILHNTAANTFHPIFYTEAMFPGGPSADINERVTRFKSKMHHTGGFPSLEAAQQSINADIEDRLRQTMMMSELLREIDTPDEWDGNGMPVDIQLR